MPSEQFGSLLIAAVESRVSFLLPLRESNILLLLYSAFFILNLFLKKNGKTVKLMNVV